MARSRTTSRGVTTTLVVPGGSIEITNPDKVLFPAAGTTKREVIDYYVAVAPFLLPHFKNRPVTLKRYPDGIRGEAFYEKDKPSFTPGWVATAPVWRRSGESQIHYILINDVRTLAWCAQIASIELHPFLHRAPKVDQPTSVVFDLDPGEGADIFTCAQVAFWIRDALAAQELTSFVKVSGSKGLQVYVPLNTPTTYEVTQPFARALAERMEREHPATIVARMAKALRVGKVFIDWSQNADHKTTVGVYSMRAKRDTPFVSMPVTWLELEKAHRRRDADRLYWSPDAALKRLDKVGDLFAPVLSMKQKLPQDDLPAPSASKKTPTARKRADVAVPRRSGQGSRRRFVVEGKADDHVLRLELGDVLTSWMVAGGLPRKRGEERSATAAPDVPLEKLPSAAKRAIDIGHVEVIEGSNRAGMLRVFLTGAQLTGEWQLARQTGKRWTITRTGPTLATARGASAAVALESTPTKATRRTNAASRRPPAFIAPMMATLAEKVPRGPEWIYEVKLDGYRAIATKDGDEVRLYSRKGNDLSADYPAVANAVSSIHADTAVLDGEIVALDPEGRPSFQALQHRANTAYPVVYYAFDLLHRDGRDLRSRPLDDRKEQLGAVVHGSAVRLSENLTGSADQIVAAIQQLGLEGLIAKRRTSAYQPNTRSHHWIKVKFLQRQEFVIGAYKPGAGNFEALTAGYYDDEGKLWFAGKVRNGFTPHLRAEIWKHVKPLRSERYPFADTPSRSRSHWGEGLTTEDMTKLRWLKPVLVAEVGFVEWTKDGKLRHPTFLGLRFDKDAREVRREVPVPGL